MASPRNETPALTLTKPHLLGAASATWELAALHLESLQVLGRGLGGAASVGNSRQVDLQQQLNRVANEELPFLRIFGKDHLTA